MLDGFGWGSYSPSVSFLVMPLYADLLRMQAIELNDQIRKSSYSFELKNNKLTLFPIPLRSYTVFFDYVLVSERNNVQTQGSGSNTVSDLSNVPYDRIPFASINDIGVHWIYEYTLGTSMTMLGLVRGKYTSVPIPGAETTLNGADLIAQGNEKRLALVTDLKELLMSMGREVKTQAESVIATSIQQQLSKVPTYIYIK
jgi:hypothetical protein